MVVAGYPIQGQAGASKQSQTGVGRAGGIADGMADRHGQDGRAWAD